MASPDFLPRLFAIGPGEKNTTPEQFPVIMRAKNEVREIPRSYLDEKVSKHQASRAKWVHAGHTLLTRFKRKCRDALRHGGIVGLVLRTSIFGKTLLPSLYRRWTAWLRHLFVPSIATTLTVDKLAPAETARFSPSCRATGACHEGAARTDRATQFAYHAGSGRGTTTAGLEWIGRARPPLIEDADPQGLSRGAEQLCRDSCAGLRLNARSGLSAQGTYHAHRLHPRRTNTHGRYRHAHDGIDEELNKYVGRVQVK